MKKPAPKEWPTAVVLSLYTGRMLCAFSEMHKFATFLVGAPVWTHQFADRAFNAEMAAALERQHPALKASDVSDCSEENWQAVRDREVKRLGKTLAIHLMGESAHYAQAFTLPLRGKEVIVVNHD